MSQAWIAAFVLLAGLSILNSLVLVAALRQIGVLHQRIPATGPGSFGPDMDSTFEPLALKPIADAELVGNGRPSTAPITVLTYVTPSCSLCKRIPDFLRAYARTAPAHEQVLLDFVLATDSEPAEAEAYAQEQTLGWPLFQHPEVGDHYRVREIGAPYVLALEGRPTATRQTLLAGGIVNTLEQLEDLLQTAVDRHSRRGATGETTVTDQRSSSLGPSALAVEHVSSATSTVDHRGGT